MKDRYYWLGVADAWNRFGVEPSIEDKEELIRMGYAVPTKQPKDPGFHGFLSGKEKEEADYERYEREHKEGRQHKDAQPDF
jgi:hypothetical protein